MNNSITAVTVKATELVFRWWFIIRCLDKPFVFQLTIIWVDLFSTWRCAVMDVLWLHKSQDFLWHQLRDGSIWESVWGGKVPANSGITKPGWIFPLKWWFCWLSRFPFKGTTCRVWGLWATTKMILYPAEAKNQRLNPLWILGYHRDIEMSPSTFY